jgi:uncharacterized protein (TIGR02246 family)
MKTVKTATIAMLGLMAVAGCQKAAMDTSADEAAIRALTGSSWADAYNAGDADKLAATYWDDAVVQPPGAPAASGRVAIRAFLAADSAAAKAAGMKLVIAPADKVDVSGDLAYDAGSYSVTDASNATVETGKYVGVYKKRDGKWMYIRDTWNSDKAPAPPPASSPAAAPAGDKPVK